MNPTFATSDTTTSPAMTAQVADRSVHVVLQDPRVKDAAQARLGSYGYLAWLFGNRG